MSEDSVQPISDEMLLAIGRLIITSSAVEAQVGFQILRMISPIDYVMDHAWPLVAGMDFKVKLDQVRTLIGAYPEPGPALRRGVLRPATDLLLAPK